jgi:hypothetical protein
MTCPAPESLVPFALGQRDRATAAHISGCSSCQNEVARLRESAHELHADQIVETLRQSPECLDELTLAVLVHGQLEGEARQSAVDHLASCAHCRRELAAINDLVRETSSAQPTDRAADTRSIRWPRMLAVGTIAAGILLVVVSRRPAERAPQSTVRQAVGGVPTPRAPRPIAPLKTVTRADSLVWSSVPRAVEYRATLYASDGTVRWTIESRDTSVAVADAVSLSVGATYFWRVEAETAYQRWIASDLVDFQIIRAK